jgi:hypothetical protein
VFTKKNNQQEVRLDEEDGPWGVLAVETFLEGL